MFGVAELVDVVGPLTLSELGANASKAGFPRNERVSRLPDERTFAWVLQRPHLINQPVPYVHPYGAVIWVNLPPAVEGAALQASGPRFLIGLAASAVAAARPRALPASRRRVQG
jgi:hypothetical protein